MSTVTIEFGDKTNRTCGTCQLCCILVPVRELGKEAGQKCKHQCRKGCAVYHTTRPASCRIWSCQWRRGDDTGLRPDRSHLVVDCMPDFIVASDDNTGEQYKVGVIQVWIDPRYPGAHKDPAFRRYVAKMNAEYDVVALIRTSSDKAFLLIPPAASATGAWLEKRTDLSAEEEPHTPGDVAEALGMKIVRKDISEFKP